MTNNKFKEMWLESWHLENTDMAHLTQRMKEKYGEDVYLAYLEKEREWLTGERKKPIDLDEVGREAAKEFYDEYGVWPKWWQDPYQMIEF